MSWTSTIVADIPVAAVSGRTAERDLSLDLYVPARSVDHPAGPGLPPLVVYIHGGGWREGTNDRPPGFRSILARGLAIASLQYRFSGEGTGLDMLADLRRGVQIARDVGRVHGIDTDGWVLWGISAGGHLVSLLAHRLNDSEVTDRPPASEDPGVIPPPAAVAPWCGVFDLTAYASLDGVGPDKRSMVAEIEAKLTGADASVRASMSPITMASADSPPHLFVHGARDDLVPPGQSRRMHEALLAAGADSELMLVPDRDHGMPPDDSTEIHRTIDFFLDRRQEGVRGGAPQEHRGSDER